MADQTFNVSCGFFDSINQDRLYTADDMNKPYSGMIYDGILPSPAEMGELNDNSLKVIPDTQMSISVSVGKGIFAGKWFEVADVIDIVVPNNNGNTPRRDSVIVQIDKRTSGRAGNIVYRTGTPSSNPMPPDIGTVTNVYEWRLANIYVAPRANTINADAITDLRGSSECPWVSTAITAKVESQLAKLTTDSGWVRFTLESGATAETGNPPAVRRYGNMVYLRGAFNMGAGTTTGSAICTLPFAYKPSTDHEFTTAQAGLSGTQQEGFFLASVVMRVDSATGTIRLKAASGDLDQQDAGSISIATCWPLG